EQQHGHVTADTVAHLCQAKKHVDRRLSKAGMSKVKLQRIAPAGGIRIAPVSEDFVADANIVLRFGAKFLLGALHQILGMVVDPGMIERHMVGYEVEHQLDG